MQHFYYFVYTWALSRKLPTFKHSLAELILPDSFPHSLSLSRICHSISSSLSLSNFPVYAFPSLDTSFCLVEETTAIFSCSTILPEFSEQQGYSNKMCSFWSTDLFSSNVDAGPSEAVSEWSGPPPPFCHRLPQAPLPRTPRIKHAGNYCRSGIFLHV